MKAFHTLFKTLLFVGVCGSVHAYDRIPTPTRCDIHVDARLEPEPARMFAAEIRLLKSQIEKILVAKNYRLTGSPYDDYTPAQVFTFSVFDNTIGGWRGQPIGTWGGYGNLHWQVQRYGKNQYPDNELLLERFSFRLNKRSFDGYSQKVLRFVEKKVPVCGGR